MRYLRLLLANPGQEFHVLAMVADVEGRRGTPAGAARLSDAALERLGMHRAAAGDAGVVLDAQARAAYRARMADLEAERDEAEAANDVGRYDRAVAEIEFLERELANAVGLGGRMRRAGSPAERARLSVTRALRTAIARMAAANPSLGSHLDSTVHTGTFCRYAPGSRAWPPPGRSRRWTPLRRLEPRAPSSAASASWPSWRRISRRRRPATVAWCCLVASPGSGRRACSTSSPLVRVSAA